METHLILYYLIALRCDTNDWIFIDIFFQKMTCLHLYKTFYTIVLELHIQDVGLIKLLPRQVLTTFRCQNPIFLIFLYTENY